MVTSRALQLKFRCSVRPITLTLTSDPDAAYVGLQPPNQIGASMSDEDVANAVAQPVPHQHEGALALRGYLQIPDQEGPDQDEDPARLYVEDTFRVWLEFTRGDVLYHIHGTDDPCCPMGTTWIKREAPVRKVEAGYAYAIVEAMTIHDDPAGGPTPPYRGPTPPYR